MSFEVEVTIKPYKIDGKQCPVGCKETLIVKSPWNSSTMVILKVGDKEYEVLANDMIQAINRAKKGI